MAAELGAMVAVKSGGRVLLGVMLEMNLTGPAPWHAWGKARFQILFFTATAEFDVQAGEAQPPPLPAPVQLRPLLLAALQDPRNWATRLPRGEHPLVVLREQPAGTEMLVHPLADLQVSQRVAPLDREITRFGNTRPEGERCFKLKIVGPDGVLLPTESVSDFFAPAQFRDMSDEEKLSAPAFEKAHSGIHFAVRGYDCGTPVVEADMQYEEGPPLLGKAATGVSGATAPSATAALRAAPREPLRALTTAFVSQVGPTGAVGLAALHHTGRGKYRVTGVQEAPTLQLKPRSYTIVGDGLELAGSEGRPERYESYSGAMEALQNWQAQRTQGKVPLRVVPYA